MKMPRIILRTLNISVELGNSAAPSTTSTSLLVFLLRNRLFDSNKKKVIHLLEHYLKKECECRLATRDAVVIIVNVVLRIR